MKKVDPFTRTPGVAGKAYIDNKIADTIIENFCSEDSSKYVYKITGLRGSGKSVEYGNIIRTLKEKDNWLVYPLSASGSGIPTLIAKISMESFIDSKTTATSISSNTAISGNAAIIAGSESINISKTYSENERFYSEEATLTKMITQASNEGYNILVGIDDISKTPEMVNLLSLIGSMILEGLNIYLVVTGLSENIEDFSNEKNLSFFKRADSLEVKPLNKYDITFMYQKLLGIDTIEAREIEQLSMGYAYAYQVLGSLYFSKSKDESIKDLIPEFENILFKDSYDLIWKSLTPGEKELVRLIYQTKDGKAEDIKKLMKNPNSYSVFRKNLINKHLIDNDTRGYLKIRLPRFDKFIEIWGED